MTQDIARVFKDGRKGLYFPSECWGRRTLSFAFQQRISHRWTERLQGPDQQLTDGRQQFRIGGSTKSTRGVFVPTDLCQLPKHWRREEVAWCLHYVWFEMAGTLSKIMSMTEFVRDNVASD